MKAGMRNQAPLKNFRGVFGWLTTIIRDYWFLLKPRQTLLLVYSGLCSMLAGSKPLIPPILLTVMVGLSLFLSIAGATALTNWVDRDLDALMQRTRGRPLPSKRINPPSKALLFGLILVGVSLPAALHVNMLFLLFLSWGVINSVIVYNFAAKRRTPYNVLLASPTGAMPVLGGWIAVKELTLEPVLIALSIVLWIPIHVWSVALRWREDYTKAAIPMLPLKIWRGERIIALFGLALATHTTLLTHLIPKLQTPHTLIPLLLLNLLLIILSLNLTAKPTEKNAWLLFKYTSPYTATLLTLWATA